MNTNNDQGKAEEFKRATANLGHLGCRANALGCPPLPGHSQHLKWPSFEEWRIP
jgi:hypothetical protein